MREVLAGSGLCALKTVAGAPAALALVGGRNLGGVEFVAVNTLNLKLRLTLHAKRGIFAQLTHTSQIICRNCEESW